VTLSLGAIAVLAAAPSFFAQGSEETPPPLEPTSGRLDRLQQFRG